MRANVIILGPGRTGSSILAGIVSQAGYDINAEKITSRKSYPGGDYENPDLVKLNKKLFLKSGYGFVKVESFYDVDIDFMDKFAKSGKIKEYENFIDTCTNNSPWLWKDPRLIFTIHFWRHLIDLEKVKFIFITRNPDQVFRSHSKHVIKCTKKEVYQRYKYQEKIANNFFSTCNINPLRIEYPEIWQKELLLSRLNNYLKTNIAISDYNNIVRPNINKKESELLFWSRYYWGVTKLIIQKTMRQK